MKVHLFNPENDLALGLDCENYTPSPHAQALHHDGALFPSWWAGEGDFIIVPPSSYADREWLAQNFGFNHPEPPEDIELQPSPWGWSRNARKQFLAAGVREDFLPDDLLLQRYRQLSHRSTSVELLKALNYEGDMPLVTDNAELAMAAIDSYGGAYVKSPWSGSGRGVFHSVGLGAAPLRRRVEGIIHRQGSVIIERPLDKQLDFAMLYQADPRGVKFHGLSIFEAESRGMYAGNIVAPQASLMEMLAEYVSASVIDETIQNVGSALEKVLAGRYTGPVGVDMMIYRHDGMPRIMPCIEINLRNTMGFVATAISDRLNVTAPMKLTWHNGAIPSGAIPILRPGKQFTPILNRILQ